MQESDTRPLREWVDITGSFRVEAFFVSQNQDRVQLERKDSVIHVVVRHLEDLSSRLHDLAIKSRDFR